MYFVNDIYRADDNPESSYVVLSPYPRKSKLRLHRSTVVRVPDHDQSVVHQMEARLEATYLASDPTADCSIHNVRLCMCCIFAYPNNPEESKYCGCLSEDYFDSIADIHDAYTEEYEDLLDRDFTNEPEYSPDIEWYELKVAKNISFPMYGKRTIPAPRLSGSATEPTATAVETDSDRLEYILWLGANTDVLHRLLWFAEECSAVRSMNYCSYIRCAERDALSRTLRLYVKLDASAARAIAREFYPSIHAWTQ